MRRDRSGRVGQTKVPNAPRYEFIQARSRTNYVDSPATGKLYLRTLALARMLTPERKTSILTNTSLAIEVGMNPAAGKDYRSVIFLQDELTRAQT